MMGSLSSLTRINLRRNAGLPTFEYHAAVVSLLAFHGFHDEPQDPLYIPTLASECRRRLTANLYAADKGETTFSGRPPLLGRRYMSTPLPLDLSDDDLFSDHETLAEVARTKLDGNGWDIEGKLHPSTFIRTRTILATIRDEIIELALRRNHAVPLDRIRYAGPVDLCTVFNK
jgi:hypothetical protein